MSDAHILASAKRRLHANGYLYRNLSAIGFARLSSERRICMRIYMVAKDSCKEKSEEKEKQLCEDDSWSLI